MVQNDRSALKPHHLGELLVARLLERVCSCGTLGDVGLAEVLRAAHEFRTEARLEPLQMPNGGKLTLDGEHKIDVLAIMSDGASPVPIEVKLGESLTTASFLERTFRGPSASKHVPPRLSGSVSSLLAVHCQGGRWNLEEVESQALRFEGHELASQWILVARRKVIEGLPGHESLSRCILVTLEKLVEAAGGADRLDQTVRELVLGESSFADRWGLR